jgi:pyruvate,water dikinase
MAPAVDLEELAARPRPEAGGKAGNLARLVAAGLPVPPAIVLIPPAGAAAPGVAAALAAAAAPHLARLGPNLAVRSSGGLEDGAEGSAAGLYASRLDVAPAALADAIAEVLASATSPAIAAYLARRGVDGAPGGFAVVVQRRIVGHAAGVAYGRSPDPRHGDAALIEVERGELVAHAVVAPDGTVRERAPGVPLDDAALAALADLARRAARAIDAPVADVEWVLDNAGPWLVQARPVVAPREPPAALDPEIGAGATPGTTWRWDVEHNPDPLSPAQIGLVERVAARAPEAMRVLAGHLYYAEAAGVAAPALDAAALRAVFDDDVVPRVDRALAAVEGDAPPRLADALAAYDEVHAIYTGRLGPALRHARAAVAAAGGDARAEASELGRALERCVDGSLDRATLHRLAAPLAPAWDVAAPTYGEAPALLDRALAAVRRRRRAAPTPTPTREPLAALVAELGERDDRLLFRAQTAVRRALLALGARLGLAADDAFYLPLPALLALEAAPADADRAALATAAAAARDRREVQRRLAMPLALRDGVALADAARVAGGAWRGRGFGGVARGRVARADDLGRLALPDEPAIVVARALTAPMVALVAGAVAIVTERGGLLGHAATIARELGLACVVGCRGAHRDLVDGEPILVDGAAGLVVRLARSP